MNRAKLERTKENAPDFTGGRRMFWGRGTVRLQKIDFAVFQNELYVVIWLGTSVLSYGIIIITNSLWVGLSNRGESLSQIGFHPPVERS